MSDHYNLAFAIYRHCLANPDSLAVVCQKRSLTYGELGERASRLASCLTHSRGWQRVNGYAPRVGILASRGVDACVALLGACWAGATYVPIALKQPEERILTLLAQCKLSAVATDDVGVKVLSNRLLDACPPLVVHVGQTSLTPQDKHAGLVELGRLPSVTPLEPEAIAASETAYIIFTSGTTGVPKGVLIPAAAARHYAAMIAEHLDLRASDRALETCDISFDFSVHNMFSTWEVGAALHILPANLAMNAVKLVRSAELTVWNSVPSLAGMLRQMKALGTNSLHTLRVTVFGGEQLPESTVMAWRSAAPNTAIFNLYGPTEATVFCLSQAVDDPVPLTPGRDIVPIGKPLPGSEAGVVDERGEPLPDNTPGELVVGGRQLASGYLGAPELTATRFPSKNGQRWYRTGDLAVRDASGCFHCLGRIDNQVKVRGYRVELEEIDAHLRIVCGANLVCSVAWPLANGVAHGIVGFVHASMVDSEQVIAALKTRLPSYMLPNRVVALDQMPLNSNGKVDRAALRPLLEDCAI
jgi:amino acid adenylation domain-containing protein